MTQPSAPNSTSCPLFPQLENSVAPLEDNEDDRAILDIEKKLVNKLGTIFAKNDILEGLADKSILPPELFLSTRRVAKPKLDPIQRIKDLPTDEVEDEEETEDEENEDEEVLEDEEEDAGGDYLVSHFDNGENYEDNDEEGDDMTI